LAATGVGLGALVLGVLAVRRLFVRAAH
jgi:hypothetical protein